MAKKVKLIISKLSHTQSSLCKVHSCQTQHYSHHNSEVNLEQNLAQFQISHTLLIPYKVHSYQTKHSFVTPLVIHLFQFKDVHEHIIHMVYLGQIIMILNVKAFHSSWFTFAKVVRNIHQWQDHSYQIIHSPCRKYFVLGHVGFFGNLLVYWVHKYHYPCRKSSGHILVFQLTPWWQLNKIYLINFFLYLYWINYPSYFSLDDYFDLDDY